MSHGHSINYEYVLDAARRFASTAHPRVLDYGCGGGTVVRLGVARGLDIEGVDTYAGDYDALRRKLPAGVQSRIHRIDGPLPFPDAAFDVVVSNQVFEHIADPPRVLAEIRRVLKPGGVFLALFGVREGWYEGHVRVYFAHRLQAWPMLQRRYLALAYRLGFRRRTSALKTAAEWSAQQGHVLQTMCYYHRVADVRRWWREAFGEEPRSLAADWLLYRMSSRRGSKMLERTPQAILDPLCRAICRVRAGEILLARR
jgi:SAM-dependent methyltransferase